MAGEIIMTYWAGPTTDYVDRSLSSVKRYADRIGATHKHVSPQHKPDYPHPAWGKQDCLSDFLDSKHQRLLFLDCDIIVADNAPSIFETHPHGNYLRRDPLIEYRWAREFERWCSQNHGFDTCCQPYFNTGVMLMERWFARDLLERLTRTEQINHGTYEQHTWNYCMKHYRMLGDISWLGSEWNWMNVTPLEHRREDERWFDHYPSESGKAILAERLEVAQ